MGTQVGGPGAELCGSFLSLPLSMFAASHFQTETYIFVSAFASVHQENSGCLHQVHVWPSGRISI